MTRSRKLLILAMLLLVIGLGAGYFWLRVQRPPDVVRLLPEGDFIVYANLRPVHLFLKESRPVQLESDYQDFVNRTGIQFERDLDEVAMSRRDTADGRDVESSEVFVGRFDPGKLSSYLRSQSAQSEDYRGRTVYTIPHEGHTVRVSLLDNTKIAVTNMASAEPMHGMIDRFHGDPGQPQLVKEYYQHVPTGSLAWVIDRMPAESDIPQLPGGLSFGFLENTVAVASLRYDGDLLLRADAYAASNASAANIVESAKTFFAIYRTVSRSLGARGNDPDVKAAIDSIHIEQSGNAAVFTAQFSPRFVKKIVAQAGPEVLSATPTPPTAPAKNEPQPRRKK